MLSHRVEDARILKAKIANRTKRIQRQLRESVALISQRLRIQNRRDNGVLSDDEFDPDYYFQGGGSLSDGQPIIRQGGGFGQAITEYIIRGTTPHTLGEVRPVQSIDSYLASRRQQVVAIARKELHSKAGIKLMVRVKCMFVLPTMTDAAPQEQWFSSFGLPIEQIADINPTLDEAFATVSRECDEWAGRGSGFSLSNIEEMVIQCTKFHPNQMIRQPNPRIFNLRPGRSFMEAPEWVNNKKVTLNPMNHKDDKCFHYTMAMLSGILEGEETRNFGREIVRKTRAPFQSGQAGPFTYTGTWPAHPRDMDQFEKDNAGVSILMEDNTEKTGIAVNILGVCDTWEEGFYWVRHSPRSKYPLVYTIYLILLHDPKTDNSHYILVKPDKLNALLIRPGRQNDETGRYHGNKEQHCFRCLWGTRNAAALKEHIDNNFCQDQQAIVTELPSGIDRFKFFEKFTAKLPPDFIMCADFECLLAPQDEDNGDRVLHQHVPSQFGVLIYSTFTDWYTYRTGRIDTAKWNHGGDIDPIANEFINAVTELRGEAVAILQDPQFNNELDMSEEQEEAFQDATICHICTLPFEGGRHPSWEKSDAKAKTAWKKKKQGVKQTATKRRSEHSSGDDEDLDEEDDDDTREIDYEDVDGDGGATPHNTKVRDHDHRVARHNYRGAAHAWCNLQFRTGWKQSPFGGPPMPTNQWKIPLVMHNLRGYDEHLIIGNMTEDHNLSSLNVIPQAGEEFLSFSFNNVQFIDSVSFLQNTLDGAVNNMTGEWLGKGPDALGKVFPLLVKQFESPPHDLPQLLPGDPRFALLLRKGVFPYEYMDHPDRFKEPSLPPISAFHSRLSGKGISEVEYAHAQAVWEAFRIKDLGQYQDLYLLLDVFLLSAAVDTFRNVCHKTYQLEALRFITAPSLTEQANLVCKPHETDPRTGETHPFMLELCDDSEAGRKIYEMCESNKRGGITSVPGRYSKIDDDTEIAYLDATNLYGFAMSQPLPLKEHGIWLSDRRSKFFSGKTPQQLGQQILSLDARSDKAYLLTIDSHIPEHLHDYFSDYPPLPISRTVEFEETSPHYRSTIDGMLGANGKPMLKHDIKTKKLVLDLKDKKDYTIHLAHLQLLIKLGVEVTRVTEVYESKQEAWMKSYIDKNTNMRNATKNESERSFFKLMNNSAYGKFLQDDRRHRKVDIIVEEKQMEKALRHPMTTNVKLIRDGRYKLAVVEKRRKKVKLDKPLIVGITILEWSKYRMYDFFYNTMKRVFGADVRLLMTDTDSLVMEIKGKKRTGLSFQERLVMDGEGYKELDMSVYGDDHPAIKLMRSKGIDPKEFKGIVGKMKDEEPSDPIAEFVALKAKMYSFITTAQKTTMKAKGVAKKVLKAQHSFTSYKECLLGGNDYKIPRHQIIGIHSKGQKLRTDFITKQTLSPLDSKRYMLNATHTLPYGHHKIPPFTPLQPVEEEESAEPMEIEEENKEPISQSESESDEEKSDDEDEDVKSLTKAFHGLGSPHCSEACDLFACSGQCALWYEENVLGL